MRSRGCKWMIILTMFVVTAGSLIAAERAKQTRQPVAPAAKSSLDRAVGGEERLGSQPAEQGRRPLGRAESSSISPGRKVGDTWYDYQTNGSMGRLIDWGWDDSNQVIVHHAWMRQPGYPGSDRYVAYNCYFSVRDSMLGQLGIHDSTINGGYPDLDAAADNRASLSAHTWSETCVYWDFAPGFGFFGVASCIPDSLMDWCCGSTGSARWPKHRYHDIPGETPVTHVAALRYIGDEYGLYYFRKVGTSSGGEWDFPPYIIDTVHDIAQDVACSNTDGKMALVWIANLPDDGDCDTCSSNTGRPFAQADNDLYYQVSYDYGMTFAPRVNVTRNVDGEEGHRPYTDLSPLIGSDNNLRIGWNGRHWPADANQGGAAGQLRCRMFYWGENLGMGGFDGNGDAIIRTAANLEWDQTTCNGGAWQLNGSKMSLSECDGKLYYLWTQFNDIPNGIEDDCHERAWHGDVAGSANGELYLAVSDDGGFTWDMPRNLTNTYTPHCDSATGEGGRCQSEHWSSMAPHGANHIFPGSEFVVVDPSGGYTGDYFLDVQYIDDPDPGGIVQDEGTWQQADVRWFRLPCVEPMPVACLATSWLYDSEFTPHGVEKSVPLTIENSCNTDATFTVSIIEETGPEGWLTTSGFESGFLPSGDGVLDGTVTMNTDGIVNAPMQYVELRGSVVFEGNFVGSPVGVGVVCWVIPEDVPFWLDTVSTGCLALVVNADGNYGNLGAGKVNMDFFNYGDCDDLEGAEDTIPGDATIYLYDGSPVICWPDGDSVICNYSIFGESFWTDHGFLPQSREPVVDSGDFYYYQSEFLTRDTGIKVLQSWYAPREQSDSCKFLVHRLQLTSHDGETHDGLTIGEAIDWDIPSDTANRNNSGFLLPNRLIYQRGSEYNEDDDLECLENSDRFGGLALLQILEVDSDDTTQSSEFYGAYTEDNATWIYQSGGFVPRELDSLMGYNEGYVIEADSTDADLHSVMTYRYDYTLTADRTLVVYSCLASDRFGYASFVATVEKCRQWYHDHVGPPPPPCCQGMRGNIDNSPEDTMDISDLVYLVDYMFTHGPEPPCFEEADVNGDGRIDINDLVCIVDGMFLGLGWDCIAECP